MKAAVLEEINGPLTVDEVGIGEPAFGQVLIKVLVSGICGSQLQEIAGNKGNGKFVPHLMGHEGAGIVEKIGIGVTKVKPGEKVVMHWRKGDGIESDFPCYEYKGKKMPSGKVTTFSEYSLVSENRITPVPMDTPDELCALLGCSLSTALGTITNEANVLPGESVLIIGAGGLGMSLIKAARLVSAYPIVAVDIHEHKRAASEAMGAHHFINAHDTSIKDSLKEEFNIEKLDVIIETSGQPESIAAAIPLLAGSGRFFFIGQPKPGADVTLTNAYHLFEGEGKTLKATQGGRFSPTTEIPRYIKLYKAGLLQINDLITHRVKLDDINEAIGLVRAGQASRVLIEL